MADRLRLRLHIRRHELPDTRIVYAFAVDDHTTVARLLEQLNDVVPLESLGWGLDDYVVELRARDGGETYYECLHYHPVAPLLDKDDELRIRPLAADERKNQRLAGRLQIARDGKRLRDGVPFGRPLLKRPAARPLVYIPPLKRRRVGGVDDDDDAALDQDMAQLDGVPGGLSGDNHLQLVRYASGDDDDDDDDEDSEYKGGEGDEDDRSVSDSDSEPSNEESEDSDDSEELDQDELAALQDDLADDAGPPTKRHVRFAPATEGGAGDDSQSAAANTTPMGRGKPQTQKRNARRRAKRAMERAAARDHAAATPPPPAAPDTTPRSDQRRLGLDLGAGRRLLSALGFGGGGRKASEAVDAHDASDPPSEEPSNAATLQRPEDGPNDPPDPPDPAPLAETDPCHWKQRIRYRAVECWDGDAPAGDPPFPFVQRWGAQPQAKAASGKRKQADAQGPPRKKRAAQAAVEDDTTSSESSSEDSDSDDDSSDSDFELKSGSDDGTSDGDGDDADNDDDGDDDDDGDGDDDNDGDADDDDDDDPPLPADVAALPPLPSAAAAAPGTVVTWKSWALSEKTGWQPQIRSVTATVLDVKADEGAGVLRVRLAARDRDFARAEKSYDEETGERVYGKFEVPDEGDEGDEEEDETDTGEREVAFAEMMEPRIVVAAPGAEAAA